MARIPDPSEILGPRPTPQNRQGVARRSGSPVGGALAGIGGDLLEYGQQRLEKEDRLNYAAAKSAYLSASEAAKRELEDDPDYATFEERYTTRMKTAQEESAKLIQSRGDRSLFESEAKLLGERGKSDVLDLARGKRIDSSRALTLDALDSLHDVSRGAADETARMEAIKTSQELIEGAVAQGIYSQVEGRQLREQWASDYAADQVNMALNREDPFTASKILQEAGDKMDWRTRSTLEGRTTDMLNLHEDIADANSLMGIATQTGAEPVAYGDPLRGKGAAPVPGGRYGASRDYGQHKGTDFRAKEGTPVFAIGPGTAKVSRSKLGGNIVTIEHDDGTVSRFMHLQDGIPIKNGDRVTPDTQIGRVGTTGRSTGPHLHMEVIRNGQAVNPEEVIGKAAQPYSHDPAAINAAIDARTDWTPQKRERVRAEAMRRISRDEQTKNANERAESDAAWNVIANLGNNFTDVSQVPNYYNLDPKERIQIQNRAEANRTGANVKANGDVSIALSKMAIEMPDQFGGPTLEKYRHVLTPGEYARFEDEQSKLKTKGASDFRPKIDATIGRMKKWSGVDIEKDPTMGFRVRRYMETQADEFVSQSGRKPTQQDYDRWFVEATKSVEVERSFIGIDFLAPDAKRSSAKTLSPNYRAVIVREFRQANGREPSEDEIKDVWERMGKPIDE